ncbi:MAG: hypothetical protein ABIE70_06995, partial [bacterium]
MNNGTQRLACIIIVEFPLELLYQEDPALRTKPVVVTCDAKVSSPIIYCNQLAFKSDIEVGMTVSQANVLCNDLVAIPQNKEREIKKSLEIYLALQEIGPLVETQSPGTFFMESSGLMRLHHSEKHLARTIINNLSWLGYPIRVGIAGSKFVAELAAQSAETDHFIIVPEGRDARFIEDFDVNCLTPNSDIHSRLKDLGLTRVGQLKAIPGNEIVERFGSEGRSISLFSKGQDKRQFLRQWPDDNLSNKIFLTYHVRNIKAIISHVITLLTPLLSHLGGKGLGSNGIVVTLTSVDGLQKQFRPTIDNPTLSVGTFVRQLELIMGRITLKAPISEIEVAIQNEYIVALISRLASFDSSDHITTDCHSESELLRLLTDHNVRAISMTSAYLPESSYELVGAADIRKAHLSIRHSAGSVW